MKTHQREDFHDPLHRAVRTIGHLNGRIRTLQQEKLDLMFKVVFGPESTLRSGWMWTDARPTGTVFRSKA